MSKKKKKTAQILLKSLQSVKTSLPSSSPSAQITLLPPSSLATPPTIKLPVKTAFTLPDIGEDYSQKVGVFDKLQEAAETGEEYASDIGAASSVGALAAKHIPKAQRLYNPLARTANVAGRIAKPAARALSVLDAIRGLSDQDYREQQYANMDRLLENEDKLGVALQIAQRPTTATAGMVKSFLDAKDRLNQAEAESRVAGAKKRYLTRERIRNINQILSKRRDELDSGRPPSSLTVGKSEDYR